MPTLTRCFTALLLSLAVACAGTETGNPSAARPSGSSSDLDSSPEAATPGAATFAFEGRLGYVLRPSALVALRAPSATSEWVVRQAWFNFGDLTFEATGQCSPSQAANPPLASAPAAGPVELAASNLRSPLYLRAGEACGLRLALSRFESLPPGAPPELLGASLLIVAEYKGTPLLYRAEGGELRVLSPNGFLVNVIRRDYLLAWDLERLLGDAPLAGSQLVSIDEAVAPALFLHPDRNGNGLLDADEAATPLGQGAR